MIAPPASARTLALAVVLGLCSGALAADSYVDALNGSDMTGDGSSMHPWRSVTHALTRITDPPSGETHAIHLAPGVYAPGTGEVFPLTLRPRYQLIGEAGPTQTVLDGQGGNTGLVSMRSEQAGEGLSFGRDTSVVGLTLRDARYGVHLYSDWLDVGPTLSDLSVHGTEIALFIQVDGDQGAGTSHPLVERVTCSGNEIGLRAPVLGQGSTVCTVVDSVLSENFGYGIQADGVGGSSRIVLKRTRVDANGIDGIRARYTNDGGVTIEAERCSISDNLRAGYRSVLDTGLGGSARAVFDRCTLTGNAGAGILARENPPIATHPTELTSTIVWGNHPDVLAGPPGSHSVDARYSDIGSGAVNNLGGNRVLDPAFWAAEVGDHHLRAESPCIDAGDPNAPPDEDGSRADMGAFPFDGEYAPAPHVFCIAAPNSAGPGATISASGSPSLATNDFVLRVEGCPPDVFGVFFYGVEQIPVPFGDGFRCVGHCGCSTFRLHPAQQSDASGLMTRPVDFSLPPAGSGAGAVLPGSKWSFQLWYRDIQGPAGNGFNFSDAVSAWFLP